MNQDRRAVHRQRLREKGLKPLEVWLPKATIESIDAMKSEGESRDAIILKILTKDLERRRDVGRKNQPQLAF
ncbi:antitoxin MazE-like protein [Novosphingobium sp. HII-3]|uniref:antitoxin MazE-like protein n=1 Tax=Novosphingobium sp. HII-3 TaxID=2075565 RepID=UPI001304F1B2|nr:antitoxin MazE-like protein [Novosphingobium sp. HII-3]